MFIHVGDVSEFHPILKLNHIHSIVLVPGPGMEPVPPAVEVWSPNHWTARERKTCSVLSIHLSTDTRITPHNFAIQMQGWTQNPVYQSITKRNQTAFYLKTEAFH